MKARFYVMCFNFYPERPFYVPHFDRHSTVRFSNLANALKYAFNDREARGGFSGKNSRTDEVFRYGGCEIRRGKSADTDIAVAHIYYDGTIEYYSDKAQSVAERLAR